jgi:tetratricopeptide (TPR) repeat protein
MAARFSGALLIALLVGIGPSAAVTADPIAAAADRYASGDHDGAVAALGKTPALKVAQLTAGLEHWIAAAEPAQRGERARLAAAFALEVVWRSKVPTFGPARQNLDPHGRVLPREPDRVLVSSLLALGYIPGWSAQQFPVTGPVDTFERAFWLAAIGIIEEGSAWHLLQSDVLPVARRRLTDEPRVRLADVLARTNRELGPLRLDPFLRRDDLLADDDFPSSVTRRIPSAIRLFETLIDEPALAGEAELRMGYLEIRRRKWAEALSRFDRARDRLTEPILLATTDYLAGWIHERRKDPDAAIDAYRRAHAIVPTMNNLSLRLAALLFLGNARAEGYEILDAAFKVAEPPRDLLITLERGDARFVQDHLTAMRASLK